MLVVGIGNLGALIAASSLAFTVVGRRGLPWLGIKRGARRRRWWPPMAGGGGLAPRSLPARLDVNALNPKGTVFLLAVVPQFLDLAARCQPQWR